MTIKSMTVFLFAFLAACAQSIERKSELPAQKQLARAMVGTFEKDIGTDSAMRDRRIPIEPLGAGEWLYIQVNHTRDLSVYRQRILQLLPLDDGRVEQITWTINHPERLVDLWDNPEQGSALNFDDLSLLLGEKCSQIWSHTEPVWYGLVDPQTCIVDSPRRGEQIRLGAEASLSQTSISLAERGYDLQGEQIWGTAQEQYYTLLRVTNMAKQD